ncbi:MAG: VWA-like domain-containing protein [Terriglobales bacterium]|jgi:predicted metal-dependent peptidase
MKTPVNPEEKLCRARTQLLLNQPFFGTLCLRLKLVAMSGLPTMATDGRRLVYNPAFVAQLTPAELEGVIAHEVMHVALAHHCRRGDRELQLWNEAADYAVNPILLDNGITLPGDLLIDAAFRNLSAEEIYAQLLKQQQAASQTQPPQSSGDPSTSGNGAAQPNQPQSSGNQMPGSGSGPSPQTASGSQTAPAPTPEPSPEPSLVEPEQRGSDQPIPARPGGFGEVMDATNEDGTPASPAEMSRQRQEWATHAEQAMCSAKACGRMPGGIERQLKDARESQCDWRAILRDFISATDPSDYRWTPPNRRFVSSGLYLPSVIRSGVGEIVIAVDTSGSIGGQELEQFAGEITAISDEARPERIHVVYCDAAVQSTEEFGPSEPIKLSPKGGGGTDFRPPFQWIEEEGIRPKCLIYLTDLCCASFPEPPEYPVLWVTDSRRTAPFGETLRIGAA